MGISAREKVILNKASSETIEIAFGDLLHNLNDSQFLSSTNFLRASTIKIIDKQFTKRPKKRKKFLSKYTLEYISASSLLHNIDSWTYFGHGISSLLKGDEQTARHLFYYSELRASMAFLATQGIGIFSGRHILATKDNKAKLINEVIPATPAIPAIPAAPGVPATPAVAPVREKYNVQGTHEFTWEAFEYFFTDNDNLTKIFDNYLVEGISMNLWLEKFNVNPSFRIAITRDFLNKLSFDLDHFSKDREARNEVSYRPSGISSSFTFNIQPNLTDINQIWNFSEPDNKKGEIKLDYMLLTQLLQMAFKETHPHNFSHARATSQYNARLARMLNDLPIAEARRRELSVQFNMNYSSIYEAMSLTDISSQSFNKGILYRSFIFARLSNVFCNKLLKEAPAINKTTLEFWWKPLGLHFGLWDFMAEPDEFADLWEDLADLKAQIEEIVNRVDRISTNAFWKDNADMGFTLSTCSRIGFWGLGI